MQKRLRGHSTERYIRELMFYLRNAPAGACGLICVMPDVVSKTTGDIPQHQSWIGRCAQVLLFGHYQQACERLTKHNEARLRRYTRRPCVETKRDVCIGGTRDQRPQRSRDKCGHCSRKAESSPAVRCPGERPWCVSTSDDRTSLRSLLPR